MKTKKVRIEVRGGCAEVVSKPDDVTVEIKDFDCQDKEYRIHVWNAVDKKKQQKYKAWKKRVEK